jgi:hypothetical protein
MVSEVSRWLLTAEARVRDRLNLCGVYGGQSGTGTGLSHSYSVYPVSIISPSLYTQVSPPHEVCDSPDQAAHYHTLCPS